MSAESVNRDVFSLLCAKNIGVGVSREVWSSDVFPDCVVKIEDTKGMFQNVVEWEIWQRVVGTPFERWFAPCRWISSHGLVLVQKRTTPPTKFPDRMPAFLCDFKRTNYGLYEGRVVCHDYGTALIFEHGMTKRMRKANWWDE